MRSSTGPLLVVIAAITILSLYMIWPDNPGLFGRPIVVRPGLDIQGGLRVLMTGESAQPVTAEQMEQARRVIDRRVNALGVAEAVVQVAGNNRIIVELPGVQDPEAAISVIQQTALLEFVNFNQVPGCSATMPQEGQYILTDRQVQLRSGATQAATPEATAAATAEGTAAATQAATSAATAEGTAAATQTATTQPTTEPTAAATTAANPTVNLSAAASPFTTYRLMQQATPEATAAATQSPTQAATTEPTAAATGEPTAEPTAAPTAEGTPPPPPPAPAVLGSRENPLVNPCTNQPFNTVMTGAGLRDAQARLGGQAANQYVVAFQLATGHPEAENFARHTAANVGQPLAIVLDGEVLSAPIIQAALTDGGEITGSFTLEEARTLALQLRSGALPISLRIESLEQVGASLGAESVQASIRAGLLGILTVFAFLLIYYRIGGLAASLALLVFAAINFALYKFIPVTLTLSAITGFLISIATAIDGNILIFERIKEEVRSGRQLNKAIELGFARAWTSIRDSNISTIMIGFILYFFGSQFGASAVRGFAVTLILGLIINLFTAVIVTRVFLNVIIGLGGERLARMNVFGH